MPQFNNTQYNHLFINNHSTTSAVQRVISEILERFDENEITTMCFIDLQKCFDTIDHSVLLKKLEMNGFNYAWFTNYLNCRKTVHQYKWVYVKVLKYFNDNTTRFYIYQTVLPNVNVIYLLMTPFYKHNLLH